MSRSLLIFFIVFIPLFILNCSSQNVKNDENLKEIEKPADPDKKAGSMDFRVVDETLNTRWVDVVPEGSGLEVFSGKIAVHGNEPFTYFVLQVNDSKKYGLIGNQKFIDYLKTRQGDLIVAGTIKIEDKINWLKVFYVIQGGDK